MTITGFEDVEEMLNKLANPYEMAEKAVNKAAPIVEKNLKTKMGYLEYGVRSHGQEPRPVRAAAVAQSENAVMQVMEEVIGAEVDKL